MDIDAIIREALEQGWTHDRTTRGHHQLYAPGGKGIVTFSGTPSDKRSIKNSLAEMKKLGFVLRRGRKGLIMNEIMRILRANPNTEYSNAELRMIVRSKFPETSEASIYNNIRKAASRENVARTAIGLIYRKVTMIAQPAIDPPKPKELPPPVLGTGSEQEDLDSALEALAKIERIIRKHREIAKYLASIMKETQQ